MQASGEWTVVFYVEDSGSSPVGEFLSSLDQVAYARCMAAIERLRLVNIRVGEPLAKKVQGDLWELRRESRGNTYRVFYFFFAGRKIVLLHAFQKKTQRIPRREIELAQRRLDRFVRREGGDQ